jgi:4-hydroxybenzoate polyprenyltransferase
MSKLRVWLELSRGANLPTVWSNVFMGWLIAVAFGGTVCVHELGWVLLSTSFLYVAGMFLNDAADVEWDRKHFPDRPIPAGKIKLGHVQQAGLLLLSLGLSACLGWLSFGLTLFILAYTRWHKTQPALSPWLMGICRAFLPAMGYFAVCAQDDVHGRQLLVAYQVALLFYTASISLLARHEATGGRPSSFVSWFACTAPFICFFGVSASDIESSAVIIAALVAISIPLTHYLIPDVGARVTERIAGLVLLDYVVWRQIAPGFVKEDVLSSAGVVLLLLYGTALGLRRLMPTT